VRLSDGEVYEKHAADLIRYATVLVGPDHAADVVSTVVLRVLKRRGLGDLDDPKAYLFRSVMNECRSWGRRRKSGQVVLGRFFEREASEPLDSTVADRVSAAEAVWRLPPRHRSAAYLVYWLDLPITEAAQILGVSPGTVKRYVHEAREKIREELS
jgi:RNA polymerase sigma factor (sigma-70 family)